MPEPAPITITPDERRPHVGEHLLSLGGDVALADYASGGVHRVLAADVDRSRGPFDDHRVGEGRVLVQPFRVDVAHGSGGIRRVKFVCHRATPSSGTGSSLVRCDATDVLLRRLRPTARTSAGRITCMCGAGRG